MCRRTGVDIKRKTAVENPLRPSYQGVTWNQTLVSLLIVALGLMCAKALRQVGYDLRLMHSEYTLAAVELGYISADILQFRVTIVRALEAPTKKQFEEITASHAEKCAAIQYSLDCYAAASLPVSRSGRSAARDLQAVRESLDARFRRLARP